MILAKSLKSYANNIMYLGGKGLWGKYGILEKMYDIVFDYNLRGGGRVGGAQA